MVNCATSDALSTRYIRLDDSSREYFLQRVRARKKYDGERAIDEEKRRLGRRSRYEVHDTDAQGLRQSQTPLASTGSLSPLRAGPRGMPQA
jgi:hypothetical protein